MYSAISGYAEVKNHNSDFITFDMKISSYRTAQRNDKNYHWNVQRPITSIIGKSVMVLEFCTAY